MLAPADVSHGDVHGAAARGISGSGSALPDQATIQRSFGGYDISNVQAHTDAAAANAAASMGASAYATGHHVVLGAGGRDLHTQAHEAAHVVQQRAGVSLSGGIGKAGDAYEQHADRVADAVVQGKSAEGILGEMAGGGGGGAGVGVQCKPSDPEQNTPGTKKTERTNTRERSESETSEETDTSSEESVKIRAALSKRVLELEKCRTDAECADLLHELATSIGCPPAMVRMLWQKTEAGVEWRRKQRLKAAKASKQKREKVVETEKASETTPAEAPEAACTDTEAVLVENNAAVESGGLLNRLAIVKLWDHVGFSSAMDIIQNKMEFANAFDATPQFTQAVSKAVFGGVKASIRKGTLALTAGPGKAVGDYIFKVVDALVDERERALAARADMKVGEVLNSAIFNEVKSLDEKLGPAILNNELRTHLRAALEVGIREACMNGESVSDATVRMSSELQAHTLAALGFNGLTIAQDRVQDALKTLLVGLTADGHIDHGNVKIEATRRGDGYELGTPEVEHRPPILRVAARSGALADAITLYIEKFGGSINMLRISKKITVTVVFNDIGDPFFGYSMNGSGTWIEEGDAGTASIHPVHLLKRKPHGPLEDLHFDTWRKARGLVHPHLERHRVMGDG